MSGEHHIQMEQQLQEAAATFVSSISNRTSLITITRTVLSPSNDKVIFYVSIFPEEAEGPAFGFLMRKRGECREYLKTAVPTKRMPHVEFEIDAGDKHRRRVDELLNE